MTEAGDGAKVTEGQGDGGDGGTGSLRDGGTGSLSHGSLSPVPCHLCWVTKRVTWGDMELGGNFGLELFFEEKFRYIRKKL